MSILIKVTDQTDGAAYLGLRLSGIRLASPLDESGEAILTITWASRSQAQDPLKAPRGVSGSIWSPPPASRITLPPTDPARLDADFLAAAWALGAWDVQRTERAPLAPEVDPLDPGQGITCLAGDPYQITGIPAEDPPVDLHRWAKACARHGWMSWYCRPMWMAPEIRQRAWIGKDRTLLPDGRRAPRAWTAWEPVVISANHQTIIRIGRANHGNR